MTFLEEFTLLLKARYPVIYVSTFEEDRLEYTIRKGIKNFDDRVVYSWDFIEGFTNSPRNLGFAKKNPIQALELIENFSSDIPSIFLLKDFDKFLTDISISRKLKNLLKLLKTQPKTLVIVATQIDIPVELNDFITVIEFDLPSTIEIKSELKRLFNVLEQKIDDEFLDQLVQSCQGLSLERIRRALSKSIAQFAEINKDTLDLILSEKRQIISQTQILEYKTTNTKFKDIGGLKNLKMWLYNRSNSFTEKAKLYGLPTPKGLLIAGIQGTGKSLIVKAIANDWQLPLLSLDIGKLFAGLVGESERKVRQMIQIVESLAPCILWIDEIDKAFMAQNNGDNGTTNRVLATFITWLSEKTSPVFVVATANNFNSLPLEIIRKGRFDEIFFVNLPTQKEREQIFNVFLQELRPNNVEIYDISLLSEKSKGFSGAEIKQAIFEGMHFAFQEKRDFSTQDILNGLEQIVPLSEIDPERTNQLQNWAFSGRIRLAS